MNISKEWVKKGLLHAAAVFVYVLGVAWFISHLKDIFGPEEPTGFFAPLFMLLLLIISATVTGLLVLGRPAYLYFNNQWKEAMALLLSTLGWLVAFLVFVAGTLLMQ